MRLDRKKIVTIILLGLILVVFGVGVYVVSRIPQSQAPGDTLAASPSCGWCEGNGANIGSCPDQGEAQNVAVCGGNNCCRGWNPGTAPAPQPPPPPPSGGTGPCWGHNVGPGEICCAGCIQGPKPNTRTCNQWIDLECSQPTCGGEGTFPTAGQSCCPGLTQCPNGRCGFSCGCAGDGQTPAPGQACCGGLNFVGGVCTSGAQPGPTSINCGSVCPSGICSCPSQCGGQQITANQFCPSISPGGPTPINCSSICPSGVCVCPSACGGQQITANQFCPAATSAVCTSTDPQCNGRSPNTNCNVDGNSGFCIPTGQGSGCKCQTNNTNLIIGCAQTGQSCSSSTTWRVYECAGCDPTGGCHDTVIASGQTLTQAQALLNSGANCTIRQMDAEDGSGQFASRINCSGSCYGGTPPTTYSCIEGYACAPVQGGEYTSEESCLANCQPPGVVPPGTPPPPPSSTPYCGDAICAAGEACERVSPGSNTFAACSGATGAAPTGPNVSSCYGIELNQPDTTSTCQYCGDGVFTPGREQCDPTAPAGNGNNPTQCNPGTCTLQQTANQCIDLVENGVDPITTGAGNFVEYTLVYQNSSTTNPYPNIRLRVGPTGTPVGRDANNPGSALVSILPVNGYTYDPVTSRHTYRFRWEAVSTSGTPVTDGTYDVRVLLDGSNDLTEPAACLETLQTSSVAPEEPLFNIIKASAPVCEDNGNAVINYTLTVTNIGPVQGVIDFVRDDLDDAIVAAGITPTNINPSYGTYSNGVITWTGSVADRTFAAGQSKQYTYTVTIPSNQVINFISSGIYNQAQVQYDTTTTTDNVDSFDLRTFIECSVTSIPDTGIFDDGRFLLIGVILTILGILSYKFDIVKRTPHALTMGLNGNFSEVVDAFRPFEDRVERKTKKKRK